MDTADLKEYISIIVDLEKNRYLQEKLIAGLRQKISRLGIPAKLTMLTGPRLRNNFHDLFFLITISLSAGVISAFCVILPLSLINWLCPTPVYSLVYPFCTVSGIVAVCFFIYGYMDNFKSRAKYEKDYAEYQYAVKRDRERLAREAQQKALLEDSLGKLEKRKADADELLSRAYAMNIIYPKYRTLAMVCSISEYICSGRCTTLGENEISGSKGAYNILEEEIRLDRIILKLDQILVKLDEIKSTQYMLYAAVSEGNRQSAQIMSGIDQLSKQVEYMSIDQGSLNRQIEELQKDSALTAYNTERIEKELSYMNRMNFYAGKYDDAGMFWRRPPV